MRFFYNTGDKIFERTKIFEKRHEDIVSEVPDFNRDDVVIKRVIDWFNVGDSKNWEASLADLKNNKRWIAGWDNSNLWFNFPLMFNGTVIGEADTICPKTISLLRSVPGINVAGFALLLPHSKLLTHTDPTGPNYNSMAFNMMLYGNNSHLMVGPDAIHTHEVGKAVIFNSEWPHCATNESDSNRVILYMDIKLKA
jgi:hypothetical protein